MHTVKSSAMYDMNQAIFTLEQQVTIYSGVYIFTSIVVERDLGSILALEIITEDRCHRQADNEAKEETTNNTDKYLQSLFGCQHC